ncbi:MAG TPA: HdeD family acid-resistance protein [Urbifossiella sp.]|nr:HdeD family acid-resistance protein [Urbifossiella sp.]
MTDTNTLPPTDGLLAEELHRLGRNWGWLVAAGAAVTAIGIGAVAYSFLATLTTVIVIGALLLAAGTVQVIGAFVARTWRGFFVSALVGVLHILVGGIMTEHPLRAAAVLTLVLAVALLVGGAARLLFAVTHRYHGRGWTFASGLISLVLGVAIWRDWPEASLWVIGTFAGIDLAFAGWAMVMLGLAAKAATTSPKQ